MSSEHIDASTVCLDHYPQIHLAISPDHRVERYARRCSNWLPPTLARREIVRQLVGPITRSSRTLKSYPAAINFQAALILRR
jgi:hypothetical protein